MKYILFLGPLMLSLFTIANEQRSNYKIPGYEVAHEAIQRVLHDYNFELSYEYRVIYEDDQIVTFYYNNSIQKCTLDVRSESLKLESFSCSLVIKKAENTLCDKDNYYIFAIDDMNIYHLDKGSRYMIYKDPMELLRYNSYGTDEFISIIFSDNKMTDAVLMQGLVGTCGDVYEDLATKYILSANNCKYSGE